jgi:hypothetical protein
MSGIFEYTLANGTQGWCWGSVWVPREGDRSVLPSENARLMEQFSQHPSRFPNEQPTGYLRPIIAEVAWQYRRHYFGGGEPEVWYEHVISPEDQYHYYRLTFTSPWRSGIYGEALREPVERSAIPWPHLVFVEGYHRYVRNLSRK